MANRKIKISTFSPTLRKEVKNLVGEGKTKLSQFPEATRKAVLNEILGFSKKEKDAKKLKEDILQAFAEVDKFNLEHLFAQPGSNSNEKFRELVNIRLHNAGKFMPTVKMLMPELFEMDQNGSNASNAYVNIGGKSVQGIIPSKFAFLMNNGTAPDLNDGTAKQNLKAEIRKKYGTHGTRADQPPREW